VTLSEPDGSPSIADGVERRLDPRLVDLERTIGWIMTAVVSGGLFFTGAITLIAARSLPGWAMAAIGLGWIAVTALLGWWLQRWPAIYYRYASYVVDAEGIEIRLGVVWRTVTNVPRSRVQHTDVSQGPIERRYGLGTLIVYTAGTDHSRVTLSGLDFTLAQRLRTHLLPGDRHDAV
jgi:uncharacterized protein